MLICAAMPLCYYATTLFVPPSAERSACVSLACAFHGSRLASSLVSVATAGEPFMCLRWCLWHACEICIALRCMWSSCNTPCSSSPGCQAHHMYHLLQSPAYLYVACLLMVSSSKALDVQNRTKACAAARFVALSVASQLLCAVYVLLWILFVSAYCLLPCAMPTWHCSSSYP